MKLKLLMWLPLLDGIYIIPRVILYIVCERYRAHRRAREKLDKTDRAGRENFRAIKTALITPAHTCSSCFSRRTLRRGVKRVHSTGWPARGYKFPWCVTVRCQSLRSSPHLVESASSGGKNVRPTRREAALVRRKIQLKFDEHASNRHLGAPSRRVEPSRPREHARD